MGAAIRSWEIRATVECGRCGRTFGVEASDTDRRVKCPFCGARYIIAVVALG